MMSRIGKAARTIGRQRAIVVGGVVLLVALVAVPTAGNGSSAPYAEPRIECRRTAPAGGPLTVVGKGFPGGADIVVRFDGAAVGDGTTRTGGGFVVRATVPDDAVSGVHTVTAAAEGSGATASCVVAVRP